VKGFLDALQLVQSNDVVAGAPKQFGLDKPAAKITVDGTVLAFGNKPSFDTTHTYALSGGKIALVPSSLADYASKAFADWRDKAVLRFKVDDVTAFSVKAPLVDATFTKKADKWSVATPVAAPADVSTVDGLLSSLSTSASITWLDDSAKNPAKWGLDKPQATVTVGALTLKIGKKVGTGYAGQNSLSPAVFTVPLSIWNLINRPLMDWRDKKVLDFQASDATDLQVTSGGATKELQKQGDKWQLVGGKSDDKTNYAALDLLQVAQQMTAQDFVDHPAAPAIYGLDKPTLELKITAKTPVDVQIGRAGKQIYAKNDTGQVFVLPSQSLTGTKDALATLFPKK
jgi:hypothetical protein